MLLVLLSLVGASYLVGTLRGGAQLVYYPGPENGEDADLLYVEWWDGPRLLVEEDWAEVQYRAGRYVYEAGGRWRPLSEHPKSGWLKDVGPAD